MTKTKLKQIRLRITNQHLNQLQKLMDSDPNLHNFDDTLNLLLNTYEQEQENLDLMLELKLIMKKLNNININVSANGMLLSDFGTFEVYKDNISKINYPNSPVLEDAKHKVIEQIKNNQERAASHKGNKVERETNAW